MSHATQRQAEGTDAVSRVLIVDDSKAMCRFIEKALSTDPELEVIGHALDPFEAREMIKRLYPDVLTLDVEMPRMDGLTFLRNLMRLHPLPTVMLSSLTAAGAAITLDALEAGAVDFMVKRHPGNQDDLDAYVADICRRVRQAGRTRPRVVADGATATARLPDLTDCRRKLRTGREFGGGVHRLVAIGASTGGPEALRVVLEGLNASRCALAICQHMPERFMAPFAERLDRVSAFDVRLAVDDEPIVAGRGYVAPGDHHLSVVERRGRLRWRVSQTDPVHGHRPAVDTLFDSVAERAAAGSVGVLLTGMGEDGATGLLAARERGALTIVQDQHSSAVWGMPGRAWALGGADARMALQQIGPALTALLR